MTTTDMTRLGPPLIKQAYLVVYRGDARLEVVQLPAHGRVTIGRAHSNRVILPDAKCSRQHCEVFFRGGEWLIRDLDSRNGVVIDGNRIQGDHPLRFGETIGIGYCTLLFTDSPPEGESSGEHQAFSPTHIDYEIIERKSGTQYDGPSGVQRIQERQDGASALFRIARSMSAAETEEELCRVVLDSLVMRTGAQVGGVLLTAFGAEDPEGEHLVAKAVHGRRPASQFSSFLTRIAMKDQDAILAHDIASHAALATQESLRELQAESAICTPIRHAGRVLGVIHLYGFKADSPLTQEDLEFSLAVADQMGDQLYALHERLELEEGLQRVRRHVSNLQDQLAAETELVGNSPLLNELRRAIARVAPTDALVLIRGESGVGKELVARAVHFNSKRKDGPYVCVNCAALTPSLLESELFGHEKGAFTGASARRAGKFEQANSGTLFLDEIGEMSPEIQAKFLRVLEGQAFERVGGGDPINVDVRVVTATNRNLEEAVREGRFRRDLFFRLQVIEVHVPALKDHPEDIPEIAQHFVNRFAAQVHRRVRGFSPAAIDKLQRHHWPGNVRELKNVVERAVILSDREVLLPEDVVLTKLGLDEPSQEELKKRLKDTEGLVDTYADGQGDPFRAFVQQGKSLDDIDQLYIEAVLKCTGWNKSKASRILQIERTTLDRRLKKYGVQRPDGMGNSDEDE